MTDYPPEAVKALVELSNQMTDLIQRSKKVPNNLKIDFCRATEALRPKEPVPRVGSVHVYEDGCTSGLVVSHYKAIELLPGHWLVDGDTGKAKRLPEGYVVYHGEPSVGELDDSFDRIAMTSKLHSLRVNFDE